MIAVVALLAGCRTELAPPDLRITEVLAQSTDPDQGDWIELYNAGPNPVSTAELRLEDGRGRVPLPTLTIPPGGYGLITGPDVQLDRDGESLFLATREGRLIDTLAWGPLIADHSLARVSEQSDWRVSPSPTPGEPNPETPDEGALLAPSMSCILSLSGEGPATENRPIDLRAACDGDVDWELEWFGPHTALGPSLQFTPGPDEAGTMELLLSAREPGTVGIPTTRRVSLSIADDWADPNNLPIDPATYSEEWGLPVLHLAVEPDSLDADYQPVDLRFDGVDLVGQIKVRGATSAGFPKQNYTLELDSEPLDLGRFGLPKKDKVVLIGNFDDNSHVRQRLVHDTWAAMAEFWGEPRLHSGSTPVVVYMNARYRGLYLLLEPVNQELARDRGLVDGGEMFKSVNHDANFYLTNAAGQPKLTPHDGWVKKSGGAEEDFGAIDDLVSWTGSVSHEDFVSSADDWLQTPEFMDWFHLVYVFAAADSVGKNAYLYADPDDGRFRYAPWDFNHSLGQDWRSLRVDPGWFDDYQGRNAIFWHFQSSTLAETHWGRLEQMRSPGGPLAVDSLLDRLAGYDAELGPHPDRDWERWGGEYRAYPLWAERTDWTTPAEERAWVETWLVERDGGY